MNTAHFLQKDSIATQLMKVVFAWYCIIAILVTSYQIAIEYHHTKSQISEELRVNRQIFEPVLSNALWHLDSDQLLSTLNGMVASPIVSGVKIVHNNLLHKAVGSIVDAQNIVHHYDKNGQLILPHTINQNDSPSYTFDINYNYQQQTVKVGEVTVYSDARVIFNRVKLGIILLAINAMIKTIALWLLFYVFGKRILLQPLSKLIAAINAVDLDKISTFKVDLQLKQRNELSLIESSFSQMQDKLGQSRDQILELNNGLELKVQARTQALEEAKNAAESASQAKSIFMSRINHELRTPLHTIMGYTEVLNNRLSDNAFELERKVIGHIVDSTDHLLMLFEDIMDVQLSDGKEFALPLKNSPLDEIIESSIFMLYNQAQQQNITIDSNLDIDIAYTHQGRLKQVVINLLTNAIKYNKPGGTILVSTAVQKDHQNDHRVQLTVKDSGVGMTAQDIEKIFEPLSRLAYAEENAIRGFGIGLSIVKNLVERMNGSIEVFSQPGHGSEFVITLPAAIDDSTSDKSPV